MIEIQTSLFTVPKYRRMEGIEDWGAVDSGSIEVNWFETTVALFAQLTAEDPLNYLQKQHQQQQKRKSTSTPSSVPIVA